MGAGVIKLRQSYAPGFDPKIEMIESEDGIKAELCVKNPP
jgi:hypothetical protein